ncbi:MAG TPA: response regulator transcription factor [Terriglobia bacterium]|nr:response regulator transcription factor [Terriglobia bacterium]
MASQSKSTRPNDIGQEGRFPTRTNTEPPFQNISPSDSPLRVLIADDHYLVLQGLLTILRHGSFNIVGEAINGQEAIRQAIDRQPDIAILDLSMPKLNGIEAAKEIRKMVPHTKALLLTMHNEYPYILEALHARIRGYVLKSCAAAELLRAIREVNCGNFFLSPDALRALVKAFLCKEVKGIEDFAPREVEVFRLVEQGKTIKEMGPILGLTVKTMDTYNKNLMHKLFVRCGAERTY